MLHDLSKRDKKIARVLIDKGIDTEFKTGLEKAKTVITEWESGRLTNRDGYHKLFKVIHEQDKHIAKRYDRLSGSDYLLTVAALLYEGQITEDDIEDFSEEAKEWIERWISVWKENNI